MRNFSVGLLLKVLKGLGHLGPLFGIFFSFLFLSLSGSTSWAKCERGPANSIFKESCSEIAEKKPRLVKIGLVMDGSTPNDQAFASVFLKEIKQMKDPSFEITFPEAFIYSGHDQIEKVRSAYTQLFKQKGVDLVLALGVLSSSEALRREHLPLPVLAPYVAEFVLKKHPHVENFIYIDSIYPLDPALKAFKKLVSFKHLVILLDNRELKAFPQLPEVLKGYALAYRTEIKLLGAGTNAEEVLKKLPPETDAIMVGPLWHFDHKERRRLAQGLIVRRIPSFALWDIQQVKEGLLAGLVSEGKTKSLARRLAVAVMDLLSGESPSQIKVKFVRDQELTINMATAKALNIYPDLLTLTSANLLNEDKAEKAISRRLNIRTAVEEALEANLELRSAYTLVQAGRHAVEESRAVLLPRVDATLQGRVIDEDRARESGGMNPEGALIGSMEGKILLYSDKKWASYQAEQHLQEARKMNWQKVKLDIIYQAAVAYLKVLRARTIERIYKDNLRLTKANLERARIRVATGAAGPDEVYRWQAKYANDRRSVLYRESDTMSAMEALNRILHRPLQETFVPEEVTLEDSLFILGDRFFYRLMENPAYFYRFRDFAAKYALEIRPELKGYDAAIRAKERLHLAAKRQLWLPEFTVEGKVDYYLADDGRGERDEGRADLNDTDWMVGIFARIPLFEGGRELAEAARLAEEVSHLKINRDAEAERIIQNVLYTLNRIRASYPSITLTQEAAKAAQLNLELVTDAYIEGTKTIIDLLDAQNQALNAKLEAANAVYNFLIDFMGFERALGEFIIFAPEEKRLSWIKRAKQAVGMSP